MSTPHHTAREGVELRWLLAGLVDAPPVIVRNLVMDSRAVTPGDAFVAVAGASSHGLDHAADAVGRGAAAVLWDPTEGRRLPPLPQPAAAISVPGLRPELGDLADRFYGEPSTDVDVSGITGTNGKTTCAWLLAQCEGSAAAYIGTLGIGRMQGLRPATHTTPDVMTVHRALRELADEGIRCVAMEVSSHALDQGRVDAVRMPVVGFTNLTRDHLDYHGDMQAYADAKRRIFSCRGVRHAVINVADPVGNEFARSLPAGVELTAVTVDGRVPGAGRFVAAAALRSSPSGLDITGLTHVGEFRLQSRLIGRFNADNLLLVLGMLLAGGMRLGDATDALATAAPPPGRMEGFAGTGRGPLLVVDYAHTPDALAKALQALRPHVEGKLWCVFGCGGDRDPGKRSLMAEAAETFADRIVITDDNPRGEDPDRIVSMIRQALKGRVPVDIERDRSLAIRNAAASAGPGDIVLVAGKGHEDYQIYGTERRHFSDRELARELMRSAA